MNNQIFIIIGIILIFIYCMSNKSQSIINEYLNKNECNENFNVGKLNFSNNLIDMGNNMEFAQQINTHPTPLAVSLSKSLVPDFQPNHLNINPNLNSYGYALSNQEISNYYKSRGFMNPKAGLSYANDISCKLS